MKFPFENGSKQDFFKTLFSPYLSRAPNLTSKKKRCLMADS